MMWMKRVCLHTSSSGLRGSWVCINSQRTLLREDPTAKQKKQPGVEAPFHIPFFSKGDKKDQ